MTIGQTDTFDVLEEGQPALKGQLIDPFGRVHDYLRISLTDKCNLRCSYCMPDEKVKFAPHAHLMTPAEIYAIANTFIDFGIKKIRLTGGEPLVRADAKKIIRQLSELPVELSITTNATRVHEFIDTFKEAGIRSVNISLDTFDKDKFIKLTRRDNFAQILSNIHLLIAHDFDVKINVVAMAGVNDNEVCDFVAFTKDHPVDVRFIEFMPFPGNGWSRDKVFTYDQMLDAISERFTFDKLKDADHSTSKNFRIPGHAGTFGIISTITKPFCGDCNRLRLTADGKMKNCLFSKGEIDLLGAFRRGEDIKPFILESLRSKKAALGGQQMLPKTENRTMITIGG